MGSSAAGKGNSSSQCSPAPSHPTWALKRAHPMRCLFIAYAKSVAYELDVIPFCFTCRQEPSVGHQQSRGERVRQRHAGETDRVFAIESNVIDYAVCLGLVDEQVREHINDVDRIELPLHSDNEALPTVLVQDIQHPEGATVVGPMMHKVVGPNMVRTLCSQSNTRAAIEPKTASLWLLAWNL